MDDQNKCINKVWIEQETHEILLREANDEGVTIAQLAAGVLNKVAIEKKTRLMDSDDPSVRMYWTWLKMKLKEREIEKVHRAASMYCNNPTEKMADDLKLLCEDADLDYKDVVNRAKNDPFSSIIAASRNGTKYGRCIKWLPDTIRSQDGRVPVSTLQTIANIEGFSKSMLDRVKRAINNDSDTPSIVSEREATEWVWVLKEERQQHE